ncbi:ras association domain-containing protein 8 [Chanos chanos]|uniref:Ras association domain-containing protein 8 n=1 Tax=Chanos chanos TaxID=29144 RepID=A0A6J2WPW9_CHACN|nr:ras association domain-containing protein 8-like [Chanos chanos]
MELKVWVDGVVRVVCGLSEETSCQEVVIALAQAIGQTGRYVLVQRLRDTERQLLANERPLESLAKLGQHSNEVQFFLRRTGPSSSEGGSQDRSLLLNRPPEPEPPKPKPKKSLTFNLGPSSSPRTKPKHTQKSPRDSPEQRASPVSSYVVQSKEEVFRQVLQQQERLKALEAQMEALEHESQEWEQPSAPESRLQEELDVLERTLRQNQAELAHEDYWEEELRVETERERGMRRRLGELHAKLDDCGRRLHDFNTRSMQLEQDIQRESLASGAQPGQLGSDESMDMVKEELHNQQRHGLELETEVTETERALGKAEMLLQAKQEELEELNKELRQCNLQQFIKQTGILPAQSHSRLDLHEQLEQLELDHLLQDQYRSSDSAPRPTAKQFLGHPRNLQHPLVSSLNPEVLTSRESSWR